MNYEPTAMDLALDQSLWEAALPDSLKKMPQEPQEGQEPLEPQETTQEAQEGQEDPLLTPREVESMDAALEALENEPDIFKRLGKLDDLYRERHPEWPWHEAPRWSKRGNG